MYYSHSKGFKRGIYALCTPRKTQRGLTKLILFVHYRSFSIWGWCNFVTKFQQASINDKITSAMNKRNALSNNSTFIITPSTIGTDTPICHNLLKSSTGDFLMPTPLPTKVIEGNFSPFHHFTHPDGSITIFALSGNTIVAINHDGTTFSSPSEITTLSSTPHCGINVGDSVYFMTNEGAYRIDYDTSNLCWLNLGVMPQFPAAKITATSTAVFSATTTSIPLSGNYPHWQGSLNKTDQASLTSSLLNAYAEINRNATTAGFFIQPILVRYHLLDANDNILFSSTPTMISSPSGFQCIDRLSLSTDDFASINAYTLSATGFQIGIDIPQLDNSPWAAIIAKIVIETTPTLDPIDTKALAQCRLDSADATHGTITTFMPGTSVTMIPTTAARQALINNALAHFSDIASPIAMFNNPFVDGLSEISLSAQSLNTPSPGQASQRFIAHTATSCGDTILWGNISYLRPFPPAIDNIIASQNAGSGFWRAFVSVKFNNSEDVIVWSGSGEDNCPSLLTPLLAFPDNNACELTISISCGGNISRQSFPLSPLPNSNHAIYIHPSLAPFALSDVADVFIIPTQHTSLFFQPGTVAVSHFNNPLTLTASQHICNGSITSITPAVRSSSSWDFARTHAYLFTTDGIFATSINAAHTAISSHIIDNRHIINKDMVAFANNAVYAIASGDQISISGAKSTTIRPDIHADGIIWSNIFHSLLATTHESKALIIDITHNSTSTCDMPANSSLYNVNGMPLIYNNESIYIFTSHNSTNIKWSHDFHIINPHQRITHATFFIAASHFDGTIALRAHGGAGLDNSYPITTLNIDGAINAPIPIKIIAPHRPYINISIDANTSPDFTLHSVKLKINS